MGVLKSILHYIGGKPNDIFDETGKVKHVHPKSKWDAWQSKYFNSPEYNWRSHKGTKNAGLKKEITKSK